MSTDGGVTCACGGPEAYADCCLPLHEGAPAPTAERLMRARYSAFVHGRIDYLERSSCARLRAEFDHDTAAAWSRESVWLGLEVLSTRSGGEGEETGEVEFVAHYRQGESELRHHERARFRRERGAWTYVDGQVVSASKPVVLGERPGRNDPCPCGSGRKFKRCCAA